MGHANWLLTSLVYLGAAVVAVPLAKSLGLGSIIGYLAAGIVIGPWGAGLVSEPETILEFAEFGVVLMLFLVGLELEPRRLWSLRRPIFGWGSVQLLGSAVLVAAVAVAAGADSRLAVVAGLGLAMSSTAIGLAVLAERNLGSTPAGHSVLAVALLQDIAAIPVLAVVPLLAAEAPGGGGGGWATAGKAAGVILLIIGAGYWLLPRALRWIAGSRTPEIFTAAALLLVVATASLMEVVGLSPALGAFLAGVLLAGSEYRRELETDLEPFKGLLLGLFFIAVGMSIDFAVVLAHPVLIAAVVVGFVALKALVLAAMAHWMAVPAAERPVFVILLAQGGEFGFVVFQQAQGAGVVGAEVASALVAAVAISMLLTPLLLVGADRWWARKLKSQAPPMREIDEPQSAPIIIAGFGRYGQIVMRLLSARGYTATILDHNADAIASLRRFGWRTFYGDATRLDLLRVAGAETARIFVLAIDDVDQSVAAAKLVREHFPHLKVVARARNLTHVYRLRKLGVELIERETLDSALRSGRSVLELLGVSPHVARSESLRFRRHSIELMDQMAKHFEDETQLIAIAKQGRSQFEETLARERAESAAERERLAAEIERDDEDGEALGRPAASR